MCMYYEIYGALPVRPRFRHADAVSLAKSLAKPAHVYFATDAVTHTLVIRVSGRLCANERSAVENTPSLFSAKWARAGAVFSRNVYGELSFLALGPKRHVELFTEFHNFDQQMRALLARQARILGQLVEPI
jgi:hypothetical protein